MKYGELQVNGMEVEYIMFKNKYYYVFINLILPNFLCLAFAILISSITAISSIKTWIGNVGIDKINFISSRILLIFLFYMIFICIYIIKIQNKDKELIPSTVYGNIPFNIYAFAAVTMRIRTIDLKLKPISLQFMILNNAHLFKINDNNIIKNEQIEYVKSKNKRSSKIINLVIADTYSFDDIELPNSVRNNITYIIERKDKTSQRKRYNSKNLIDLVNGIVEENKNGINEYNLFLFTNPETNKLLYNDVFNTVSDGFKLNLYNFNNKTKCFSENPKYVIKKL